MVAVTEKNFPIQKRWVVKPAFAAVPFLFTIFSFGLLLASNNLSSLKSLYPSIPTFGIPTLVILFATLRRRSFYYSFEDNIITLKQGILSKQQKQLPYSVIQQVLVKQDFLDIVFNLASLSLENISKHVVSTGNYQNTKVQIGDLIGFGESRIDIPGLSRENAEDLKKYILQKIKENPSYDTRSGL